MTRDWPPEYQKFINQEGYWDLYGKLSAAFDVDSLITLDEVEEILRKRHQKELEKKAQALERLERQLHNEMGDWENTKK